MKKIKLSSKAEILNEFDMKLILGGSTSQACSPKDECQSLGHPCPTGSTGRLCVMVADTSSLNLSNKCVCRG